MTSRPICWEVDYHWEDSSSFSHILCLMLVVESCSISTLRADFTILLMGKVWWRERPYDGPMEHVYHAQGWAGGA